MIHGYSVPVRDLQQTNDPQVSGSNWVIMCSESARDCVYDFAISVFGVDIDNVDIFHVSTPMSMCFMSLSAVSEWFLHGRARSGVLQGFEPIPVLDPVSAQARGLKGAFSIAVRCKNLYVIQYTVDEIDQLR